MSAKRIHILYGIILTLFIALIARVAFIQFLSTRSLAESAFKQRLSNTRIEKLRGNILDRNGIPFTNRNRNYTAFIKTAYLPESLSERERVCTALGIGTETMNNLTLKSKPLMIETDEAGSKAVLDMNLEWVSIINSLDRYGSGTLAKHVIGYLSKKDKVGQAGIEKGYENELRDSSVYEIGTVTDAAKIPIKGLGYRVKNWNSDNEMKVKLTLDYHIQKIVEDVMNNNGISGAVVVEDVVTGDVLAMSSRPDYDQNAIENYLGSNGNELFNKATAAYNLGSVFKIIDVAAFYEDRDLVKKLSLMEDLPLADIYNEKPLLFDSFSNFEHYYCQGAVNINGLVFKCSSYFEGGHGELGMEHAFAVSCNSYFIELCQKVGYRNLLAMAKKFGLGQQAGIAEQGIIEAAGSLPPSDIYYSQGDIANLSIGQGALLATPLQVADLVATIANGGIKNRVNIVDSVIDRYDNVVKEIRVDDGVRIITKDTSEKIKNLMEACTSYGTGTDANVGFYGGAGGKTGSAETGSSEVVHAWFAGYFPQSEPRYSIAVFVENGQLGGKVAAPIFAEIAKQMIMKGY